ncbi:hypothetical protein [endosymbiont GvMRE of Glomus versiforme]|uniref:hypothetical protein n=1 Tax=endosymbiont GvMRE of Glomus versiforme TaxID=2039283 RepID=UPI000EE027F5|nr:hypothetical protein [endosymbiont GvMRE of Glomus versiforme]RHZ35351.1 hypothetical protein GvMRE_IIg89 [endosymbiont GvMRE of Glomus versiforme]
MMRKEHSDISKYCLLKVIGKKWEEETEEVKDRFKKLAEDKKSENETNCPNYKYHQFRNNTRKKEKTDWKKIKI